ncbi:MAG: hypothetical protein O2894_06980 [Planctomycetota bacterium]|nr:hypothetical protein [Planctomycetota bacterium]
MSRAAIAVRASRWLGVHLTCAVVLVAVAVAVARDAAAEDAPAAERIAWFTELAAAREVAAAAGRPMLVAMHVRPRVASPDATERTGRWLEAYADAGIVTASRAFACVLRVIAAPEGKDPDVDVGAIGVVHLIVDGDSRVLARMDGNVPPGRDELLRFLRTGLARHGTLGPDAPGIGPDQVARAARRVAGASPMQPVGVPLGVPGVRLRLRWELPAPVLGGAEEETIRARVHMRWDDTGPYEVGAFAFRAGDEIDVPVDIRFDRIEGLEALATAGLHRVDLYIEPAADSYPFSRGPLHVGRVWIELGDGGGGAGEGAAPEQAPDPADDEEQPDTAPDGQPEEPPPAPGEVEDDVIEPFVGAGETVKKDDAVVAVEDPNAGVKPPPAVPLERALREFTKEAEAAIGAEGLSPGERAFLRRYFELLRKHAGAGR